VVWLNLAERTNILMQLLHENRQTVLHVLHAFMRSRFRSIVVSDKYGTYAGINVEFYRWMLELDLKTIDNELALSAQTLEVSPYTKVLTLLCGPYVFTAAARVRQPSHKASCDDSGELIDFKGVEYTVDDARKFHRELIRAYLRDRFKTRFEGWVLDNVFELAAELRTHPTKVRRLVGYTIGPITGGDATFSFEYAGKSVFVSTGVRSRVKIKPLLGGEGADH